MKRNFRFTVAYDGTRYYGWEKQPGQDMTIQGKLETVLGRMCGTPDPATGETVPAAVEVIGAGRTDAGVHAKGMVCNAYLDTPMSAEEIRRYMNRYLPEDIAVLEAKEAGDRFHSRYKAVGKTYCYTCYTGDSKPVFNRRYCWVLDRVPDVARMREAAEYLLGEHDFSSFCANPRMKKSTVRVVDRIEITEKGGYLNFTYHGTGFLQYMVRILTGTLLEVGFGEREPAGIPALIEAHDRAQAGPTAPPQGLCLLKVDYS